MDEKAVTFFLLVEDQLCNVFVGENNFYIFYDREGKYLDFKVEVYEG